MEEIALTAREWAMKIAEARWRGVSKKERAAHAKVMARARWKKARTRKRKGR